jgi:ferredoxin
MMRIRINYERCEGAAVCMKVAPEVFGVGEDDRARLINKTPSENLRPKIETAIKRCPRRALSLEP